MNTRSIRFAALAAVLGLAALNDQAVAQPGPPSFVEQNSNVAGRTIPDQYGGLPGMQDHEPSCAFNPLLPRNILCAWNASGCSDDKANYHNGGSPKPYTGSIFS